MLLPGARSVYDLNEDRENSLAEQRKTSWATGNGATLRGQVRRLAGIRKLSELPEPKVEELGTIVRSGYKIEKLVIRPEEGIALPALMFWPEKVKPSRVLLYLHERGKAADAGPGGPIEQRVLAGDCVLAVDVRGTGQTQQVQGAHYCPEYKDVYLAYMLGRSYVGMRAEDVLVSARYAAKRFGSGREAPVHLVAVGSIGVPALHAAAVESDLFATVKLSRTLISWASVIHHQLNEKQAANTVHGVLACYDLPNLVASLSEKITVEQPVNAVDKPLQTSK